MDALPFHWIDLVAIILTVLSIIFGFFRGFTREVLAVVAWLASAVVTDLCYDWTSGWIESNISTNNFIIAGIAVLGVFIVCLIVFMLLGGPLWRAVRRSSMWLVDSVLGLFFGLGRGIVVLVLLAVALAFLTTDSSRQAWAGQSRILPVVDDGARQLLAFTRDLPYERVQQPWFQEMIDTLQNQMGQRLAQGNSDAGSSGTAYPQRDRAVLDQLTSGASGGISGGN